MGKRWSWAKAFAGRAELIPNGVAIPMDWMDHERPIPEGVLIRDWVDVLIHQYGLTEEQARAIDRSMEVL